VVTGAIVVAGGAALGAAGRVLVNRTHGLTRGQAVKKRLLDPRTFADIDLKRVVRHIGDAAEKIEARSEDVRQFSAQAKRLSRTLS
jgi:hypothetical protein